MATVLLARYRGPMGFWRPVAVKRLHEALARDPAFVSMLLDEARLGSQVRHPLVAEVIDLVTEGSEVCLVMQYVHGSSLRALLEVDSSPVPIPVAVAVLSDALNGLHAAHEARDTRGTLLGVVHRDVSPHNLLVGADGFTRVTDFGIAKAVWRAQTTCDGQLKGKLAYMAPEQLAKGRIDRRADVFGAAVVLWELLAGKRLFEATDPEALLARRSWVPPRMGRDDLPAGLEEAVLRGLAADPDRRFESALQMAEAIERACRPASRAAVAAWVERLASADLAGRASLLDASSSGSVAPGISGAWRVASDSATIPNADASGDRTPSGLGPVATDSVLPRKAATRQAAVIAALAAALAVFATISFAQLRSGARGGSAVTTGQGAGVATASAPAEQRPAPVDTPSSIAQSAPPGSASANGSAMRPAPPPPARTTRPAKAPAVRSACDPPYRTDDTGVKIYKVECL